MRRVLILLALLTHRLVVTLASGLADDMATHSKTRLLNIDIVECSRATRSKQVNGSVPWRKTMASRFQKSSYLSWSCWAPRSADQ